MPDRLFQEKDAYMKLIRKMLGDTRGATAIEYGLIAALIAVAAITAVKGVGSKVGQTFNNASAGMDVTP
jgi:pilus assembly protein Flp/PilA